MKPIFDEPVPPGYPIICGGAGNNLAALRALGAVWIPASRGWAVPPEAAEQARALLKRRGGTTGCSHYFTGAGIRRKTLTDPQKPAT